MLAVIKLIVSLDGDIKPLALSPSLFQKCKGRASVMVYLTRAVNRLGG